MHTTLNIYVSNYKFNSICTSILDNSGIRALTVDHTLIKKSILDALCSLVTCVLIIQMTNG